MKKATIILSLILFSCSTKSTKKPLSEYPYRIKGFVTVDEKQCDAVWYTDTFYFRHDTVCYENSDGSRVRICPPYTIYKNE
jgi:hypothetical protein